MIAWMGFAAMALIYGTGFMFIEIAVGQLSPIELTTYRQAIGSFLLLGLIFALRKRIPRDPKILLSLVIIGLFNITIPLLLVAWAQQTNVASGLTGVLIAMNPLFTLVIAHFVFDDERMTQRRALGVFIGFIGVGVLASRNIQGGEVLVDGLVGQLAVIGAALCFASMNVFSRTVMKKQIEPIVVSAVSSFIGFTSISIMLIIHLASGNDLTPISTWETRTVFAVGMLSFFSSFVAYLLGYFVVRELGATRTSTVAYIIPIISLAAGTIFLNEVIDARVFIGTAIILSGLGIVNLRLNPIKAPVINKA